MADVTELRCWPACVGAIDWSQDGIIALASDERVELLFPNTVAFDRDHETSQWQHVSLQVPLFTYYELPNKDIAPLSVYSVGEEISSSAPIAIAWSPPGIAKHRRCALAALTANLSLSVWAAAGRPQEESSWSRRLIINDALQIYFRQNATDDTSHVVAGHIEQLRLRTRVRAFAWAPSFPDVHSNGSIGTRVSYGQQMVVVANDDNQVVIVAIRSPTSTLSKEAQWTAEVLTYFNLSREPGAQLSDPSTFDDLLRQPRYSSHVAWSPWVIRNGCYHSIIAYATTVDVRARVVTYTRNDIVLGEEILYCDVNLRYHGPLKWSPKVDNRNELYLAIFAASGLIYLIISDHDASVIRQHTHNLDGRWDQISGVCWDTSMPFAQHIHVSSLLSTLQSPTATLEASIDGVVSRGLPNWRDQIENNLVLFGVKNDLKGSSKAKVWGLTMSPLGDFIAACNSVHPSDMIEYGIPADRRGIVAISTLRHYSQSRRSFPTCDVSAESILFTIKKMVENTVEDADAMPVFAQEMVEKLIEAYPPLPRRDNLTNVSHQYPCDLASLVQAFKQHAFLNDSSLKDRYTILADRACNTKSSEDLARTLIAYRLADATQQLLSSLCQTAFSAEIWVQHQQLIFLIDAITNKHITNSQAQSNPDICDFCSAPIPFADLATAVCGNGHHFPRCGLSFVAIQAPGITKYCGICDTPYLNEEFVAAQEMSVELRSIITKVVDETGTDAKAQDQTCGTNAHQVGATSSDMVDPIPDGNANHMQSEMQEPRITMAKVLFYACDVCIYCGGKFVD